MRALKFCLGANFNDPCGYYIGIQMSQPAFLRFGSEAAVMVLALDAAQFDLAAVERLAALFRHPLQTLHGGRAAPIAKPRRREGVRADFHR
jgi:hypothetical protein